MGSIAMALSAEYGEVWLSPISLTGSSCTTERPASCSHRANTGRSAISPMPQLAAEGIENNGTSAPARRPLRRDSAMHAVQHTAHAVGELAGRRQEAHDDKRLMREVEKIAGMHQHAIFLQQLHRQVFLAAGGRDTEHRRPSRVRV